MDPWVIDANEMAASQISVFKTNLLHPTRSITKFLESSNTGSTIVVAPKGFGKTLLLKAKRISLESSGYRIVPEGQALLDKPSGSPSVSSSRDYGNVRQNPGYWKSVWTISIGLAIIKDQKIDIDNISSFLSKLVNDKEMKSPCDIFDAVVSCKYDEYQQSIDDLNDNIVIRLRNIHSNVVTFIDSIDEYYEDMLRALSGQYESNMYGGANQSYWYWAQLGIALAARELHEINPHIRIYAAMRSEVLQKSAMVSAFTLQLRSRSIVIEYSDEDLMKIIEKNIASEKSSNLVSRSKDKIEGFIGKDSTTIFHPKTGDEEDFEDFWIRHTLRRPRDVIVIGKKISELAPSKRDLRNLRLKVRSGSGEISRSYMTEMEPHLPGFDPEIILRLLKSNTLSLNELKEIGAEYAERYIAKYGCEEIHTRHVFCAMFKIGLLGYVGNDFESGEKIQIFKRPGSVALDDVDILPMSDRYLIHPSLDDLIIDRVPNYFKSLNGLNVIGVDRRWRDQRSVSYVLKGDLKGYSNIMSDSNRAKKFGEFLRNVCYEHCQGVQFWKLESGDSVLIVDENPVTAVNAARLINASIFNSEFSAPFRFGGDAGYILIDGALENRDATGVSLRTAARLEPHVKPSEIWVTEEFRRHVKGQFCNDVFHFEKVEHHDAAGLNQKDGKFDLAKNEKDDSIMTELFRIIGT